MALTSSAFAQDGTGEEEDEIIVRGKYLHADQMTALKSPTPIIDVPQSLSIVTADQITNQGFDSISDIINYTPGVTNSQGEGHRDAVVFRGVRSTADFFVDGVRDDVQYFRGFYNVEQVEILRGANALLFGRGGTGGIVNRVTKKGEIGESFNGLKASVDTFGAFGFEFDSNTGLSPSSAFRINGLYEQLNNHRDFYEGERIAVNPTLRFLAGPSTTVDLSYEYVNNERFIDRGIPVNDLDGGDFRPIEDFAEIIFGDPEINTAQVEAHVLRGTLSQNFSDNLKGVFNATYSNFDKLYQNFYAADLVDINTVRLDGYRDTTQRHSLNLSGNLIGQTHTGGIDHTIVAGAEFRKTSNINDRFNPLFSATPEDPDQENFVIGQALDFYGGVGTNADGAAFNVTFPASEVNDNTDADVTVASIFLQDEIAISDKIDVVLGARFDRFDIESLNLVSGVTNARKDEEISPRLGLIFKPQENMSVYGSYSQSFLPRSGGQFASVSGSSELLEPDVFENLEAGLKWDFTSGLSFTAAYFQNDQTIDAAPDGAPENLERRGLEVKGFELQIEGEVTENLFVKGGYAHLSGETDFTETGIAQERPRELPENTFSVWSNYQINERLGVGLGATYQDESFITDLDIGHDPSAHPTLPSFTRIDAAAYYDVYENVRIQVNIENLTDTLYFPTSHSTHQVTVGAPLNARLTVSGKF